MSAARRPDSTVSAAQYRIISVAAGDVENGRQVARQIRAGRVMVNEVIDAPDAPFGGFKQSGIGREFGRYGIAAYLETQTVFSK